MYQIQLELKNITISDGQKEKKYRDTIRNHFQLKNSNRSAK